MLVVSIAFAPCREVGGKRFSFLSRRLAKRCDAYHVIARREPVAIRDGTAYSGAVRRVRAWPDYDPVRVTGWFSKAWRAWERWFCLLDPYIGWALPAALRGIALCRRYRLNVVIVTVPYASTLIPGIVISWITGARLIIDYRDPLSNLPRDWPRPLGACLVRAIERQAIRRASAVVLCTDIMREDFVEAFGAIAPRPVHVIYNACEERAWTDVHPLGSARTNMVYAGAMYGSRRLAVVANALAAMLRAGEVTAETFRLHLYTELKRDDFELIEALGIGALVEVHERVSYDAIMPILRAADILFLPSGSEVRYAVPFKFFDYISVRRPILAVTPVDSSVSRLMQSLDCGEFAAIGDDEQIRSALLKLIRKEREYSFAGAERFSWEGAAEQYLAVLADALNAEDR